MQDMYAKIYVLQSFFAIFLRSAKFFALKFPELEKIYTWNGVSIFTPFHSTRVESYPSHEERHVKKLPERRIRMKKI